MSVTNTATVATYSGNGSTTIPYAITIPRDRDVDLKLTVDGVASTDFTISPDGFRTGSALASTAVLVLSRETPLTQEQPFPQNTTPAAADVRAAFDKVRLTLQEVDETLGRTVKASFGTPFTHNSSLGFDTDGNPIARSPQEQLEWSGAEGRIAAAENASADSATDAAQSANNANGFVTQAQEAADRATVLVGKIPAAFFNFDNSLVSFNFQ